MGDGSQPDIVVDFQINQRVRKSPHRTEAHAVFVINCIQEWIGDYSIDCIFKFLSKLCAQPGTLLIVIVNCSPELRLSIRMDLE